jgi:predicted sugar kinase
VDQLPGLSMAPASTTSEHPSEIDDDKALQQVVARGALAGLGIYLLHGGGFLVTRAAPAVIREVPDLRSVRQLIAQLQGTAA